VLLALILFVLLFHSHFSTGRRNLKTPKGLRQAHLYGRHLNGEQTVVPIWDSQTSVKRALRTIPNEAFEVLSRYSREKMRSYHQWWIKNLDSYPIPQRLMQTHWLQPEDKRIEESTDKKGNDKVTDMIASWTKVMPSLDHVWFNDDQAYDIVLAVGGEVEKAYSDMPRSILKADYWRYIIVALLGGVYSDIDTTLLKPINQWGANADIWIPSQGSPVHPLVQKNLEAMDAADKQSTSPSDFLTPPSFVLGLEADVAHVDDWSKYFARKLQISQWTFAASPGHPILLDAIQRIIEVAEELPIRKAKHQAEMERIRKWRERMVSDWGKAGLKWVGDTQPDEMKSMWSFDKPVEEFEPTAGMRGIPGHEDLAVLQFTGPGMFTDTVLAYLAQLGFHWTELQGMKRPLRIGDVVILPWTGFSPGWHDYWGNDPLGDESPDNRHS